MPETLSWKVDADQFRSWQILLQKEEMARLYQRGRWATSDSPALAPKPGLKAFRLRIAQWPSRAGRRRGQQHRRLSP